MHPQDITGPEPAPVSQPRFRWLAWLCLVTSIALFVSSALSFDRVRGYLDQFAGDGSAEPYTPAIHARLQWSVIAAGAMLLAVFFWLRFRPLTERVSFVPRTRSPSVLRVAWRTLSANGMAIGSVTLLAAILRLINLSQPIRHDEA
ncbi:MAG TPA: hypothetical protein VFG20_02150, partial [Planctomycetaceae bacterium]|nr:hypothetical protein [Planctomycetaceae bacterium]